jgi:fumarylacetoacetase
VLGTSAPAGTYWTLDQQLAHLTVNGASVRPGDLFASGTVSGPAVGQRGSLLEASWNGSEPLAVEGGPRTFLLDGDRVVLRGTTARGGSPSIALGDVDGVVRPAGWLDPDAAHRRESRP